jgi:hypothetical protein
VRRTILPALSVTLIGCGSSLTTHPGGPCQTDRTCDQGQICDQTDPAGPVCLDVNGDIDGDGIPNGKDFCEHMAGGAFDEDGDGIGDECDRCPIAKPPKTADSDGDAVDAPCDPDPAKAGEKIVLFNGFNAPMPGLPAGWTIQGGEAIATPTDPSTILQLDLPLTTPSNHMSIQVGYRIDNVSAAASEADAGVVSFIMLPLGTTTIQCTGTRTGPLDQLVLKTDATTATQDQKNLFNPASLYRLGQQLDGSVASCALISDTDTGAAQGASGGFAMDHVGLYARGATVRFAYILVTQH